MGVRASYLRLLYGVVPPPSLVFTWRFPSALKLHQACALSPLLLQRETQRTATETHTTGACKKTVLVHRQQKMKLRKAVEASRRRTQP